MTKDPVCYRELQEQLAAQEGLFSNREGHVVYFCSADCKARFDKDPEAYSMRLTEWQEGLAEDLIDSCSENFIG
jgi:YHS domain-containing protein